MPVAFKLINHALAGQGCVSPPKLIVRSHLVLQDLQLKKKELV